MQKKIIATILLASSLFLGGCNPSGGMSDSSSSSSESNPSSESALSTPKAMIGRWYVRSNSMGVIPINGIFDINEDNTLDIGQVSLTLSGHYDEYEETYKFVYGTISFIVSYDEEGDMLDWGYTNVSSSDWGTASRDYIDNSYDYKGDIFPMEQIKKYLGTSVDVPAYESDEYRLKLYKSSYYTNDKYASLEVDSDSLDKTLSYINKLIDNGYSFYSFDGKVKDETFYVAYDATKTYTIRIKHSTTDKEADLFIYPYLASLQN